jgi:hypothetical protein
MKSFLLKSNKPTVLWSLVPDNCFYVGKLPGEDYSLAISPGNSNIVIVDCDVKNNKNGYDFIPSNILDELKNSFWYNTKSGGAHFFVKYSGNKILKNCSTQLGLDLRRGSVKGNAGGYVKYNGIIPVNEIESLIKESSQQLNEFLESLFLGVNYEKEITE